MNLTNKKILFFAPDFFGYDIEIKKKLESFGACVVLCNERPSNNFFIKTLIRLNKKLVHHYTLRYFKRIIEANKKTNFDFVFIIKGEVFTKEIVSNFKKSFPKAKFILYLWDSVRNYVDIENTLFLFDRTLTFDYEDSKNINLLKFRPLFFIDGLINNIVPSSNVKNHYNLLFIGTVHSDRWDFLYKIKKEIEKENLNVFYYLYIQSPVIFIFRKLFDKRLRSLPFKDIKFSPLSAEKTHELFKQYSAILDIQHPKQTGLTMRTIETLGANKKLITTNKDISGYDFYNPNNVLIVDRNNPQIPVTFFNLPYSKINSEIYSKYSIDGWISDIFSDY